METRANYVAVGAFVVALLVGIALAALWLASAQFGSHGTRYDIYFANVGTGLIEGSPARVSGVQVGRVIKVELDPENTKRVRVTIEVTETAPIRSDSVAKVEVTSLTGGAAIEITAGSNDAPPIVQAEGQRYAVIWSKESGIQQIVDTVPQLVIKLNDLTDALSKTVDDNNRAALATTLNNLAQFSASLAAHSDDTGRFLSDAASDAHDLHQTIANLNDTIQKLSQVTVQANTALRDLDGLVQDNRGPLKEFTQHGLDELRHLVGDTRNLVSSMTRTVDRLDSDPSSLLYGDRRQGYKPQ